MRQRNRLSKRKRKPKFFTHLPSEIVIDIHCRLPIRTIISCKCVCKTWLELLETNEFVKFHLSKSVPGMVEHYSKLYRVFEFEDVINREHHHLRYVPVTECDPSADGGIKGSANGLLLLYNISIFGGPFTDSIYVVNLITRDYIQICCPHGFYDTYGFGASRITGQPKVVRVFTVDSSDNEMQEVCFPSSGCHVYTLGTGCWRSIKAVPKSEFPYTSGVFLNGNLHWLTFDSNDCSSISCFDLDDEVFGSFPSPLGLLTYWWLFLGLFAFEDCLCLSDSGSDEVVVWLMKEYGVGKSWRKEFVMRKSQIPGVVSPRLIVYPVKAFSDGDILMAWEGLIPCFYSRDWHF